MGSLARLGAYLHRRRSLGSFYASGLMTLGQPFLSLCLAYCLEGTGMYVYPSLSPLVESQGAAAASWKGV